jgi:hypothetical protein
MKAFWWTHRVSIGVSLLCFLLATDALLSEQFRGLPFTKTAYRRSSEPVVFWAGVTMLVSMALAFPGSLLWSAVARAKRRVPFQDQIDRLRASVSLCPRPSSPGFANLDRSRATKTSRIEASLRPLPIRTMAMPLRQGTSSISILKPLRPSATTWLWPRRWLPFRRHPHSHGTHGRPQRPQEDRDPRGDHQRQCVSLGHAIRQ